jgi:hypothetical protein
LFLKTILVIRSKFYQNDLSMRNTAHMSVGKPIAVSISGVSAVNPLVAFYDYDIRGRKKEVLFFCSVSDAQEISLMTALLGRKPSLWITNKENGP